MAADHVDFMPLIHIMAATPLVITSNNFLIQAPGLQEVLLNYIMYCSLQSVEIHQTTAPALQFAVPIETSLRNVTNRLLFTRGH